MIIINEKIKNCKPFSPEAMAQMYDDNPGRNAFRHELCPECGAMLIPEGRCYYCPVCGQATCCV